MDNIRCNDMAFLDDYDDYEIAIIDIEHDQLCHFYAFF